MILTFEYVKGSNNVVANTLSRQSCLNTITSISGKWKNVNITKYAKDPQGNEILEGKMLNDEYKIWEHIILYKGRAYLPRHSKMKSKIMKEYHDNPFVGHQRYYKTYNQIKETYSWKGLKKDVLKHVQECMTWKQNKTEESHRV